MGLLGMVSQLGQQAGFAPARIAVKKDNTAVTAQRLRQKVQQSG
jgi:hypothetical protein